MNIAIKILVDIIRRNRPDELKVHPDLFKHLPQQVLPRTTFEVVKKDEVYYSPNLKLLAVTNGGLPFHYTKLIT